MAHIEVNVPDGKIGDWVVDTIEVTEDEVLLSNLRSPSWAMVTPGFYKRLRHGNVCVMSNTPMEWRTNREFIRMAHGNVLINGLGLGMTLAAILEKESVQSVTVIEKSREVIDLVSPSFADKSHLSVIHADAFEYKPEREAFFDVVWHDIWNEICLDNLPQMQKLHRKYGRRCGWQGSWSREICERLRREEKREKRRYRW